MIGHGKRVDILNNQIYAYSVFTYSVNIRLENPGFWTFLFWFLGVVWTLFWTKGDLFRKLPVDFTPLAMFISFSSYLFIGTRFRF